MIGTKLPLSIFKSQRPYKSMLPQAASSPASCAQQLSLCCFSWCSILLPNGATTGRNHSLFYSHNLFSLTSILLFLSSSTQYKPTEKRQRRWLSFERGKWWQHGRREGAQSQTAVPVRLLAIHSHWQTWKEKKITRYTPLKAEIMRLNKGRKKAHGAKVNM